MRWIDAHAHLPLNTAAAEAMLRRRELSVMNICVASSELGRFQSQRQWYRQLRHDRPDLFAWCTSFDPSPIGEADFVARILADLDEDFAAGACACKVWKNLGMDLREGDRFVFVDDPRLAPVFDHVGSMGKPLVMHIAEPIACWSELDPRSPHHWYYSHNPQWHWHGHADVPSHARLIETRDAVARRHPSLTIVACHLGSLEHDLDGMGERFDRYPNLYADTSARLGDLAMHIESNREKVREFFLRYADRLIWGVDAVLTRPLDELSPEEQSSRLARMENRYDLEWKSFASDEPLTLGAAHYRGLSLPDDVLARLFRENARRLYRLA